MLILRFYGFHFPLEDTNFLSFTLNKIYCSALSVASLLNPEYFIYLVIVKS